MAHYKFPMYEDYFPTFTTEQIIERVIAQLTMEMESELAWEEDYLIRMQEHCDNVNWDELNKEN